MANLILDERDQKFVLFEMLGIDKLCVTERYYSFSMDHLRDDPDRGSETGHEEIMPTLGGSDREDVLS
jgi:hypothetical protein